MPGAMQELFEKMMSDPAIRAGMERRDAERAVRRADALARHGSAEAAFAETRGEALLREACAPYLARVANILATPFVERDQPGIVKAIDAALPLPATVAAALAEYDAAEALSSDRSAIDPDWSPPEHAEIRRRLLMRVLDTAPATSFRDVTARAEWMQRVLDLGYSRDVADDQAWLDSLKADLAALAQGRIAP